MNKEKNTKSILDKTVLVAHGNKALSLPFLLGMRELVKIFKKDDAAIVKAYIDRVEIDFMQSPDVASALTNSLKANFAGYVAKAEEKQVIADFFDLCEEQLFSALKNNIVNRHPELKDNFNIGELLINKKGARRLIVGIFVRENKGKQVASYQYMDGDNKRGTCDHVSMVSWLAK